MISYLALSLRIGEKYTLMDSCGMVSLVGVFVGTAYPKYRRSGGEIYTDLCNEPLLVFDLSNKEDNPFGGYKYAGAFGYIHAERPSKDRDVVHILLKLEARYYGNAVDSLYPSAGMSEPVGWELHEGPK